MSTFVQLRAVRGSIAPLLALLVVASGGLALGVARVGVDASLRARAQAAADAAALAGALGGEADARRLAAANGAELVAYAAEGAEVEVEVRVGEARAWARARAETHATAADGYGAWRSGYGGRRVSHPSPLPTIGGQ